MNGGRIFFLFYILSTLLLGLVNAFPIPLLDVNGTSAESPFERGLNASTDTKSAGIHEVVGGEFVEVRRLLDEIRIASIKKHGVFSDQDPTRRKDREMILERVTFDDGTEATINRQVAEDLFENDILLTLPQAEHILKEVQQSPKLRRGKRQANPSLNSFWEELTIPYVFQQSQTNSFWQNSIRAAHRHIESLTCIRFRYFDSDNSLSGKDYLQYFRGTGCWSQVGKTGGRQPVSIGYGCEALGIVAHETLHALGLWHEQSRTDRDGFIRINLDAIMPGTESNFEKRTPFTSDNMGQPYDLGSAMHYGSKAFSTDARTYTILTHDRAYQQTIGQRNGLSFKDAKMINMRYCTKNCEYALDCENDGYTDPLKCGQCRCPEGYGGMYCQQIPKSTTPACKSTGEVTAGQWPGTLSTGVLPRGQQCYWRIHPQYPNQRIELSLKRLSFPCKDACISFLEIKYKKDKVATGARLCCDVPATIYSDQGTDVLLILKTEEALDPGYEGFELQYKTVDANVVIPTVTQQQQQRRRAQHSLYAQLLLKQARARGGTGGGLKPIAPSSTKGEDGHGKSRHKLSRIELLENPYLHEERAPPTTTEPSTVPTTSIGSTGTTDEVEQSSTTSSTPTTEEPVESSTTSTSSTSTTSGPEGKEEGWTDWTKWTGCSATCGACGQRKRTRSCKAGIGKCKGFAFELERCAMTACPLPMQSTRCSGRLVMPCQLMQQLDFGTVLNYDSLRHHQGSGNESFDSTSSLMIDSNIVMEERPTESQSLPHLQLTENNAQILRRHRRHGRGGVERGRRQQFCEKRFTYHCPTSLLTISMDWHLQKEDLQDEDNANEPMIPSADSQHRCCAGYSAFQGSCIKKSGTQFLI